MFFKVIFKIKHSHIIKKGRGLYFKGNFICAFQNIKQKNCYRFKKKIKKCIFTFIVLTYNMCNAKCIWNSYENIVLYLIISLLSLKSFWGLLFSVFQKHVLYSLILFFINYMLPPLTYLYYLYRTIFKWQNILKYFFIFLESYLIRTINPLKIIVKTSY